MFVYCSWWGMWIRLLIFIPKYYKSCFQPVQISTRYMTRSPSRSDTPSTNSCFVVATEAYVARLIPNLMIVNSWRYLWGSQRADLGRPQVINRGFGPYLSTLCWIFDDFLLFFARVTKYLEVSQPFLIHSGIIRSWVAKSNCCIFSATNQNNQKGFRRIMLAPPHHPRWVAAIGLPGSPGEQRISSASGLPWGGSLPGGLPPRCSSQGTRVWGCVGHRGRVRISL